MLVCPADSSLKTLEGGPLVGGDRKEGKHSGRERNGQSGGGMIPCLSTVVCDFTGIV